MQIPKFLGNRFLDSNLVSYVSQLPTRFKILTSVLSGLVIIKLFYDKVSQQQSKTSKLYRAYREKKPEENFVVFTAEIIQHFSMIHSLCPEKAQRAIEELLGDTNVVPLFIRWFKNKFSSNDTKQKQEKWLKKVGAFLGD
ncbi:MAG: hypothetical protein Tsb0021_01340 [Chlamydiales bacterium]